MATQRFAGIAAATAATLTMSLVVATPAQAQGPSSSQTPTLAAPTTFATVDDEVTLSDELEGEIPVEPTVTDVDLAPVDAPDTYVNAPEAQIVEAEAQQEELLEQETTDEEANAGAVLVELDTDVAVVGVTWDREDPVRAELRQLIDGTWSEWYELENAKVDDVGLEGAAGGGTEPAVMIDTSAVEVIAFLEDGQQVNDLTLTVIDPSGGDPVESAFGIETEVAEEVPADEAGSDPEPEPSQVAPEPSEVAPEPSEVEPESTEGEEAPESTGTAMTTASTVSLVQAKKNVSTGYGFTIKTRKAWGANEDWRKARGTKNGKVQWAKKRWSSPNIKYKGAVVHHTFLPNSNYTKAQVPGVIRGIYRYHTHSVNFGDVGYQLLVDKFGGVWEGRAGSLNRSLQGAQALGANKETFGIAVLGDYTKKAPPAKAQDVTARAIAWMFSKYKITNPKGKIRIPHQDGKGRTVPTILGHYQATATACPGAAFIKRLPAMRNNVEKYLRPFIDVAPGDPHSSRISWLSKQGIATGVKTSQGYEYRPNRNLTRGQMAMFLYRLEKAKYKGPKTSPFADVKRGDKFYNAITWMHAKGYARGSKQAKGKPHYMSSKPLSRQDMALFMIRMNDNARRNYKAPKKPPFSDVPKSHRLYRELSWMYASGLSKGIAQPSGKPQYRPGAQVTRGQMATFLYNLKR